MPNAELRRFGFAADADAELPPCCRCRCRLSLAPICAVSDLPLALAPICRRVSDLAVALMPNAELPPFRIAVFRLYRCIAMPDLRGFGFGGGTAADAELRRFGFGGGADANGAVLGLAVGLMPNAELRRIGFGGGADAELLPCSR